MESLESRQGPDPVWIPGGKWLPKNGFSPTKTNWKAWLIAYAATAWLLLIMVWPFWGHALIGATLFVLGAYAVSFVLEAGAISQKNWIEKFTADSYTNGPIDSLLTPVRWDSVQVVEIIQTEDSSGIFLKEAHHSGLMMVPIAPYSPIQGLSKREWVLNTFPSPAREERVRALNEIIAGTFVCPEFTIGWRRNPGKRF